MSTIRLMKDGRMALVKAYSNGININNYPQADGTGFAVHIHWPYNVGLNAEQWEFLNQYQFRATKSHRAWQIRFGNWSYKTGDIEEMYTRMDKLKAVVQTLRELQNAGQSK